MRLRSLLAVVPCVVVLAAGQARAEGDEQTWIERPTRQRLFTDRPFTIQARVGFGTIVGFMGMTASYDVANRLALGAGVGTNLAGVELAGFARLRPFIWENRKTGALRALAFDVAFSTGPNSSGVMGLVLPGLDDTAPTRWDRVSWIQTGVVYEVEASDGLSFMAGVGQAWPVSYTGRNCPPAPDHCQEGLTLSFIPSASVAVGYSF